MNRRTNRTDGLETIYPNFHRIRQYSVETTPIVHQLCKGNCPGGGGGGGLNKVLYGEAPPRGPNPYPFIYHF